jgi:hypothetical protein
MNWIETSKNLPQFNKTVLLVKEGIEPKVGFLKSVDAEGNHFTESNYNNMDNIFFGMGMQPKFNPTHWCEIELPNFPQE